jgi:hypothetical protein
MQLSRFLTKHTVALCLLGTITTLFIPLLTGCDNSSKANSPAKTATTPATTLPRFTDVASAVGLNYTWIPEGKRPFTSLLTIGNGCAFLDYNNDNNLDILLVGNRLALYRGDGQGGFTDVSEEVGIASLRGHYLGCAIGDTDNDGFDDIYISGYRTALFLKNEGGKKFRDATKEAGFTPQPWGTSCAFGETVPGSGILDLYVCNYVVFGPDTKPQLCQEDDLLTSCGPRLYDPEKGVFYKNNGKGKFTDATKATGADVHVGKGLGVAFADHDGSGSLAMALANDEMPGDLFQPRPDPKSKFGFRFDSIGEVSGTAYDLDGNMHGGMGIDWGDVDNDGRLDLFVGTFQNEVKCLYLNEGERRFKDIGVISGINATSSVYVTFGSKFLDFDNDGLLDLVIANGHVQDNIEKIRRTLTYRQPTLIYHGKGGTPPRFEDVTKQTEVDKTGLIVGRGVATGDYDNDGRIDLLISDAEGKPLLLHNEGGQVGHWLGVKLIGTRSNRNGYGAHVTLKIGDKTLHRYCHADGSYMSSSDPRVHFGLGEATQVDSLTVRWRSGLVETFPVEGIDRYLTLTEGSPKK